MGLKTPATKVWEIPEPSPGLTPEPEKETPEPEPVKVPEIQRQLEPARRR